MTGGGGDLFSLPVYVSECGTLEVGRPPAHGFIPHLGISSTAKAAICTGEGRGTLVFFLSF